MSHFAKVIDGVVTEVIVAEQEFFDTFIDTSPGEWIQTSYNNNIRERFAMIGGTYDSVNDVFINAQPFPSWTLSADNNWYAATPYPGDTNNMYTWNEETLTWENM
jgi:hypothetical protein